MSIRDIRPSHQESLCDICGRTLLRGERAETYLDGTERRSVCELCKDRALHEGWIREGTVAAYDDSHSSSDRKRSLLARLRGRRDGPAPAPPPTLRDELDGNEWSENNASPPGDGDGSWDWVREPRHVRAVPTGAEQKVAAAIALFNASEHRRTVAGVARSLGAPGPSPHRPRRTPVWWT